MQSARFHDVELEIRKSLSAEKFDGTVWLPKRYGKYERSIVKIINKSDGGRAIYCECSILDESYVKTYDQNRTVKICCDDAPVIIMSRWYRSKLGIDDKKAEENGYKSEDECKKGTTQRKKFEFYFQSKLNFIARLRACVSHPQVSVRVGTWLGVLSLLLGILSIGLAIAVFKTSDWANLVARVPTTLLVGLAFIIGFFVRAVFGDD